MNTAPTSTSVFSEILAVADTMGTVHGIQPEAVLLQMLAFGSALAGDLISSKPGGGPATPAKFSLLIRTADPGIPWWIDSEWNHLQDRQSEVLNAPPNPMYGTDKIAALRRRQRVLKALNPGSGEDASMIDGYIGFLKHRKTFGFIHRIGKGPCTAVNKPGKSVALAAGGYHELRRILRSRNNPAGYWALLNGAATCSILLGWVDERNWKDLAREAGSDLSKLGFIIGCPPTAFNPDIHTVPEMTAAAMVRRLEVARFGSTRFAFEPPDEALGLLDRQATQTQALLDKIPEADRKHALPDSHLAWHLSAILDALCAGSEGLEGKIATYEATMLGSALASWAIRRHLYHIRQTFPADSMGPFAGQDLRVLRFLSATPRAVRDLQRRMRGVTKESCLRSLRRAVAAGLAIEQERERFIALPPPARGLSDYLNEHGHPGDMAAASKGTFF